MRNPDMNQKQLWSIIGVMSATYWVTELMAPHWIAWTAANAVMMVGLQWTGFRMSWPKVIGASLLFALLNWAASALIT
jgi:hypothetical protein